MVATYCRLCPATCGLDLEVVEGVVTKIKGDEHNALTRGFTCTKGRHLADFATDPNRLRASVRRADDGRFAPVSNEVAIAEIASRLRDLIDAHGPDCVALYTGTQAAMASLTLPFTLGFWKAIGSRSKFSSMTVDQAAKWVADGRLGRWAAGGQRFDEADVWMLVGTNPLVSMQGGYFTGFPIHDGLRRLEREKRRGLQLIVVDPRRTELATRADIHLQLIPGTDATLFAGLLHLLLRDDLVDTQFCEKWVPGLDGLRRAVDAFEPALVAAVCGLPQAQVEAAARLFGEAARGMVTSGTGPDMGPASNLAEHLIQTMNVVCGRFARAGEAVAGAATLGSAKAPRAEVIEPDRHWEQGPRSSAGYGLLNGELPAVSLPEEILHTGPGRVRALIVSGGNPAVAVPGKARMVEALSSLDLLVTVDPFMSETAQLADYVIAPFTHLERPDTTRSYEGLMDMPFAQYTPAILAAPPGTIDDWEFFLRLTSALGRSMKVAGREYRPDDPVPTTDEVLASFSARARVPLETVKEHPHGLMASELPPVCALPPTPDASGRFDVAPPDVMADLVELYDRVVAERGERDSEPESESTSVLLIVRRAKEVMNSTGVQLSGLVREPWNPCHMHPDDLARLGVVSGDAISLTNEHGSVNTIVKADATLRPGAASMTHGFGGPGADADPAGVGASTNRLLSATTRLQTISGMPVMTAVLVTVGRPRVGTSP